MKPLRIVNLRLGQPFDVYMGRRGHGHDGYFGNVVVAGQRCPECGGVHLTRKSTLPCFARHFNRRVERDVEYRRRIEALEGDLGCFCAPDPCHVEIIVAWLVKHRGAVRAAQSLDQIADALVERSDT